MPVTYVVDYCGESGRFFIGFDNRQDAEFYVSVMGNDADIVKSSQKPPVACRVKPANVFRDLRLQASRGSVNLDELRDEVIDRTQDAYEYFCIKESLE